MRAVRASPIAATCPIAGAPRTTISRIAVAASEALRTGSLDELVGQLALVDHEEDVVRLEPERRPEAGRAAPGCVRFLRPWPPRPRPRRPSRVEERRGLRGRAIAELGHRPDDLRRARHHLAGEAAEELAPGRVRLNVAPAAPSASTPRSSMLVSARLVRSAHRVNTG